jgi:tetratricopeptide (TPR) repeat protein
MEAAGESNLFATVDDLTRRIKVRFDVARPDVAAKLVPSVRLSPATDSATLLDRDLKDVTTSSIEAYRLYAEAIELHERFREREAIPLLERAVESDPDFALALAKLSMIHSNLGHLVLAQEYGKRAVDHAERLSRCTTMVFASSRSSGGAA